MRLRGEVVLPQVPATDDLREVEEAGSLWASRCIKDLFDEKDLEFFATRYQPFYAYLKMIEGLYQSTIGESEAFQDANTAIPLTCAGTCEPAAEVITPNPGIKMGVWNATAAIKGSGR